MQTETLFTSTLSDTDALGIGELIAATWPNPEKPAEYRAQQVHAEAQNFDGNAAQAPRSFVVREDGKIIAHSMLIPRTINTSDGEITVAGLSRVCCYTEQRGRGLGELIVRATLEVVDTGAFPFSLFQTSHKVQAFYEKLGAVLVENTIVNSTGEGLNPPFWDEIAMRYPSTGNWPQGEIDLLGPGY